MAARYKKIINIEKELLVDKSISIKDEITFQVFENTYKLYMIAFKDVEKNGQTIKHKDYNKNDKVSPNPSFKNMMELQKELRSLISELMLSPKSRKVNRELIQEDVDVFMDTMNDVNSK